MWPHANLHQVLHLSCAARDGSSFLRQPGHLVFLLNDSSRHVSTVKYQTFVRQNAIALDGNSIESNHDLQAVPLASVRRLI